MTNATEPRTPRAALMLNAGMLLVPIAIGALFAAVLKAANPSDIDVSAGLAYLRPILIVSFVLVGATVLAALVTNLVLSAKRRPGAGALWTVFWVQLAALVVLLVAQGWERAVTGA